MVKDNRVTGQFHCRLKGPSIHNGKPDTHEIVMVVGILSVPKGTVIDEHMMNVVGREVACDALSLTCVPGGEPASDTKGMSASGLLTTGMWRV